MKEKKAFFVLTCGVLSSKEFSEMYKINSVTGLHEYSSMANTIFIYLDERSKERDKACFTKVWKREIYFTILYQTGTQV